MSPEWKNPMLKVKEPKVVPDPLQPISTNDVWALINTCQRGGLMGERDRAIFLFLLYARAKTQGDDLGIGQDQSSRSREKVRLPTWPRR